MLRYLLLFAVLACFGDSLTAQGVAVNTTGAAADASAILDVQSTTQGMLVPRMTTAQRTDISSPATGLIVYDSDSGAFWCYAGSNWIKVMMGFTSLITDTDGDTRIDVETTADEDS
ncbi:MAG: hypothetical protein R3330_18090, partial [Saprospiraceae bacterium]|nr:hypothetical protein [Saprospiraceae bacterium]